MRRVTFLTPALALFVLACSEPRAVPIIGPDGSHMFHVSCGHREAECYRLAGERCPYGYDVGRTVAGAGNMLVRCRAPMTQPIYPTAQYGQPPAAAPAATYALPVQPSPPPAPPAAPAGEPPQPAASASAVPPASSAAWPPGAAAPPAHPAAPARHGKVDLGY